MTGNSPSTDSHDSPFDVAGIEADYSDLQPGIQPGEKATGSKRILQIILGVLLIVVGIPMIPLAGPGWAVILVGLNLIKPDNALVRWLRRKLPVVPDEGPIPKRYYVIGAVLLIASSVISLLYGSQMFSWFKDIVGI